MNYKLLAIFAMITAFGLFTAIAPATMSAYAIHNDEGHEDKASVGECKRFTGDADYCQDKASKDAFKEFRKN